jgi:hypothetical protein
MTAIDLTGSAEEIRAILAFAKTHPAVEQTSEPTSLDASRALNLGGTEPESHRSSVVPHSGFHDGQSGARISQGPSRAIEDKGNFGSRFRID